MKMAPGCPWLVGVVAIVIFVRSRPALSPPTAKFFCVMSEPSPVDVASSIIAAYFHVLLGNLRDVALLFLDGKSNRKTTRDYHCDCSDDFDPSICVHNL